MLAQDLFDHLKRRFTLGDNPKVTSRLYHRLQKEAMVHGDAVLMLIADVADACEFKDTPGKYFRLVIGDRLRERGFLQPSARKQKNQQERTQRNIKETADAFRLPPSVEKMSDREKLAWMRAEMNRRHNARKAAELDARNSGGEMPW